ncbi:hypothetical protein ACFWFX_18650 [Streptomyces roseolus]|uniref:hypothetical protein n=1 Tax=Streptomyces roseolus TaxID=67358 RepID=UPI0036472AEA
MKRMQCKDIPDETFREAIRRAPATFAGWRMSWEVREELASLLDVEEVPWPLFLAKARKLVAAGKIGGCPCGCRGDFHVPEECVGTCCEEAA